MTKVVCFTQSVICSSVPSCPVLSAAGWIPARGHHLRPQHPYHRHGHRRAQQLRGRLYPSYAEDQGGALRRWLDASTAKTAQVNRRVGVPAVPCCVLCLARRPGPESLACLYSVVYMTQAQQLALFSSQGAPCSTARVTNPLFCALCRQKCETPCRSARTLRSPAVCPTCRSDSGGSTSSAR